MLRAMAEAVAIAGETKEETNYGNEMLGGQMDMASCGGQRAAAPSQPWHVAAMWWQRPVAGRHYSCLKFLFQCSMVPTDNAISLIHNF